MPNIFNVLEDFMENSNPEDFDYLYEIETDEDFDDFIKGK